MSRASWRRTPPVLRRVAAATRRVEAAAEHGGTLGGAAPQEREMAALLQVFTLNTLIK